MSELLERLNDELSEVFSLRWIKGNSWEEIQDMQGYTTSKIKKIRLTILNELAYIMGVVTHGY